MIETNDTDLVRRCLTGDTTAFESLVDKYQKTIFNLAYRMTHNYQESQDITQTVFLKVYQKMDTFDQKYKFFSWLYRIAMNETLNHIHKNKRISELNKNLSGYEENPTNTSYESELSEQMQQALMKITSEQRSLIVLKHIENYSYNEIADILNISEKKVKSRLYDARQRLRHVFIQDGILQRE